ncbi:peptide-binding protein [uncultured Thiothrix sp.]|uniref:peptide-binding protein n=1 Tax=uncultured Thiothrix sp. TaxID=223185 RepID=UPI002636E841|nr:peptide-binding protein [uncultured Thiothrix sp.]
MQKRFITRDWLLYSILILLIALLLLVMYQVDRQWTKLAQMESALTQQAQDMRSLRTAVGSGQVNLSAVANPATPAAQTATAGVGAAFQRAYAATQKPDYAQGDWGVSALETSLKTLTPLVSTDAYASQVQYYVQESLVNRNPDTMEWEGLIAKSWQISPDGLTITFQMRDDVTFSDGVPLTAKDVVFTYNFIMNEAIAAPAERSVYGQITSVEAKGDYEVVFKFKEPYFQSFGLAGGLAIMPAHFYEPYMKKPQEFNQSKGLLLGSGPYRLADAKTWTPDQGSVELVRNERYWGDVQPPFNRMLWKVIQNESARLTTYRNGEIDSYEAAPSEYAKLKVDQQLIGKSQSFEYMPPVVPYGYIAWNQEKDGKPTRFADKRVRQAMSYLTDMQRIVKDIYLDHAEQAISPFNPRSKQHDPSLKPWVFNLEKAQALLKEAGFADKNGDGILEDKDGKPFEFKMIYFQGNKGRERTVLFLKDIYARAGIKLEPSPQEFPVMQEALKKRDFDSITMGWSSGIETDIYQMFHSSQIKDEGSNFISYINPELDKLIDEARHTVDEAKRMALWQQAERIMYEDQPYTFLIREQSLLFVDKRIQNLQMSKLGLNYGSLPMENYVPAPLQKYQK